MLLWYLAAGTMQITLGNVGDHTGYVLDNALPSSYMSKLQCLRKSLPIDTEKKKTAAHRRFLCAENDLMWIRDGLVSAIREGLSETKDVNNNIIVRVLPWMRFLEYIEPNGSLGPHTDALIRCKETNIWSTHTLLLFCSDCEVGGETTLLPEDAKTTRLRKRKLQKAMSAAAEVKSAIANITSKGSDGSSINNEKNSARKLKRLQTTLQSIEQNIAAVEEEESTMKSFPVQPKCNRIFFFPHECPHEGRPTVSVPKIFLRAELILKSKS